jgi:hypothetical protein
MTADPRWQRLAEAGAHVHRPLWASTGVKDPSYPDTMYVSELAIAGTVNTMPGTTLAAFADHGTLPDHTSLDYAAAIAHLQALEDAGVDFTDVTDTLECEGLTKFERSWSELGSSVADEMRSALGEAAEGGGPADDASRRGELLAIYLNDHFSGATGGLELLRRAAQAQRDGKEGTALAELARQVEDDRESLAQVMTDLGVPVDRSKVALGWLAENAGRLKPNGHLFSRSPLSDVLEVESMLLGIQGKAACWRTLRALSDVDRRLFPEHLDILLERAERQILILEEMRFTAAARTFRPLPSPHTEPSQCGPAGPHRGHARGTAPPTASTACLPNLISHARPSL